MSNVSTEEYDEERYLEGRVHLFTAPDVGDLARLSALVLEASGEATYRHLVPGQSARLIGRQKGQL